MNNHYESLSKLVEALRRCRRCPQMQFSPVSADRFPAESFWWGKLPELESRKPAGFLLGLAEDAIQMFYDFAGVDEDSFRAQFTWPRCVVVFQVKRGRNRVPSRIEIENCSFWLDSEIALLFLPISDPGWQTGYRPIHRAGPCFE